MDPSAEAGERPRGAAHRILNRGPRLTFDAYGRRAFTGSDGRSICRARSRKATEDAIREADFGGREIHDGFRKGEDEGYIGAALPTASAAEVMDTRDGSVSS